MTWKLSQELEPWRGYVYKGEKFTSKLEDIVNGEFTELVRTIKWEVALLQRLFDAKKLK